MKHIFQLCGRLASLPRRSLAKFHRWRFDPGRRIRSVLGGLEQAWVVQIGSNDGSAGDPVRPILSEHRTWRALLVEPVPFLFEQLKRNYADHPGVTLENVAVGKTSGYSSFYFVGESAGLSRPDLPCWHDKIGSFDRNHLARHLGGEAQALIEEIQVPTVSLEELLARHQIEKIDLLHIDAEGSDWMILQQLDVARHRPTVILFEHQHLSERDAADAARWLGEKYELSRIQGDSFCRLKENRRS